MYCAQDTYREPDGRLRLLLDPYDLRMTIGGRITQYSHDQLWVLLTEIMAAVVQWEAKAGRRGLGHIIEEVTASPVHAPDPLTGGTRALWRVTLGAAWARLIATDIGLYYDPAPITRLQYGISRAVARMVLSHDERKWVAAGVLIVTLLDQLGVTRQNRGNARRRLHADAARLADLGILIRAGRVHRDAIPTSVSHPPGVVSHPPGRVP